MLIFRKNITAIQGRSNELNLKKEYQFKFDIVTARAVAPSPLIVAGTENFLKKTGEYILYKTPEQAAEDLPILLKMGGKWQKTDDFELPEAAGARCFIWGRL